jgi:hypothetical protein
MTYSVKLTNGLRITCLHRDTVIPLAGLVSPSPAYFVLPLSQAVRAPSTSLPRRFAMFVARCFCCFTVVTLLSATTGHLA